ncbi:MAG: hypothetical protein IPH09_10625 [bacterium]|nr:hypothetical protein [bacterium]
MLAGNKSYLVYALFGGVLVRSTNSADAVKVRHLVLLGTGVLLFFVIYNQFVDVLGIPQYPGSRIPDSLSFLERPYHYFTGALPAMEQVVRGTCRRGPSPASSPCSRSGSSSATCWGSWVLSPETARCRHRLLCLQCVLVCRGSVLGSGAAGVAALSLLLGWSLTSLYRRAARGPASG